MSSILKVDQLQDSGGNAIITSDGAGNLTAGTIPAKTIGTGAILQVVSASHSTTATATTATYIDTGLTASITPSSSSNKILVLVNQPFLLQDSTGGSAGGDIRLMRDSTAIVGNNTRYQVYIQSTGSTNEAQYNRYTISIVDEPATSSSVVYKTQAARYTGSDYIATSPASFKGTITLMEIAG